MLRQIHGTAYPCSGNRPPVRRRRGDSRSHRKSFGLEFVDNRSSFPRLYVTFVKTSFHILSHCAHLSVQYEVGTTVFKSPLYRL
jgi:hypothetical protein